MVDEITLSESLLEVLTRFRLESTYWSLAIASARSFDAWDQIPILVVSIANDEVMSVDFATLS